MMIGDPSASVSAFSTVAASTTNHEVVTAVGMALRAMRLASIHSREIMAAQNILGIRNRLHMIGILTSSVVTQVINSQPSRNGANQQLIEQSMCPKLLVADAELAIAITIKARSPEPAAISLRSNLGQEPHGGLIIHIFSITQRGV